MFEKHEQIARDFLHRSDLVVFVISAKRAFANTEKLYLELAQEYGKKVIVVINQIDLLQPNEQQEVRRFVENQIKSTLDIKPLIFMISAQQALVRAESATADGTGNASAPQTMADSENGLDAIKAHLRGIYAQAPLARQKLVAQLETASRILDKRLSKAQERINTVTLDRSKVQRVQKELEQQSIELEGQMIDARQHVDNVLEGVRKRGHSFIDENLTIRQLGRGVNGAELQSEFQTVVVADALNDISDATNRYINAVVDQSRLYWRSVIDRLNELQDLIDQKLGGLDSEVYAEQRAGIEEAIRLAKSELHVYSQGHVVQDLESLFLSNLNGFQGSALFTISGLAALVVAVLTPGPLLGAGAAVLAAPAALVGGVVAVVAGVPAYRYYRRISRDTHKAFDERIDTLLNNYRTALSELTTRERTRLVQYGKQILSPVFARLETLADEYKAQQDHLKQLSDRLDNLHTQIENLKV